MGKTLKLTFTVLFVTLPAVHAQPPTPADQQKEQERKAIGKVGPVGMEEKAALMLKLLAQQGGGGIDPMLLLMMAKGDGDMGELMGLSMMSRMLAGPAAPPVTIHEGGMLLIIENGTVYKVNVETMRLEGTVQYRTQAAGNPLTALGLAPKAQARPDEPAAVEDPPVPAKRRPAPAAEK
ncbi:MAG: hypothetical protein COZ06_04520 [Armatimonadetes bacterium CG_4_10_14_3_um_filter_66_18]|nr:hypothetical protein [Armatimonadota bacterium]OIO94624.1 MAG: hypothetical protein AUJ96_28345 [Armatimonadetes bacterium CG2_30_66_41]PIU95083.1 MAG: hypothetical protein COS65_04195 [Armatimonadetes bacterium CG06_land_8_20_14_3_00_66_21]PIX41024.1 MAG: hypothetical protein COZ57_24440 [Armatimonadetes bacterium CG_4_8_14_3_um_filter_66_20]PIY51564.1 MAG: hypothetical protein COZ06_04520 [Armatimonadetes bacterium CG_4_10_14_3_um_filter_66_18]PIZ35148.1 MAG: hypothetical protein COY42_27